MSATIQPATMKGPAIFLAQFIGDAPPFDSFDAICGWAAGLGYKGVQVPTSDPRLIDLDRQQLRKPIAMKLPVWPRATV
jgi:sugar phosphate isomerase/epimerase